MEQRGPSSFWCDPVIAALATSDRNVFHTLAWGLLKALSLSLSLSPQNHLYCVPHVCEYKDTTEGMVYPKVNLSRYVTTAPHNRLGHH